MKLANDSAMKAYSAIQVKAITEDADFVYIEGIASTPTPDRVKDVVMPLGARFKLPFSLLWQHASTKPVGNVTAASPTKNGIPFKAQIPIVKEAGALKDRIDEAIQSLKYKLVNFVSIGFRPINDKYKFLESGGIQFDEWEWYELSLVTIPAQPEAVISSVKNFSEQVDKPLSDDLVKLLKSFDKNAPAPSSTHGHRVVRLDIPPVVTGQKTVTTLSTGGKTMTLAEQLKSLQDKRAANLDMMKAVMQKSVDEGRTLDAEEQEKFDEAEVENATIDGQVKRLNSMIAQESTVAVDGSGTKAAGASRIVAPAATPKAPVQVKNTQKLDKGIAFARYALCKMAAKQNPQMAFELAKQHYPDCEEVVRTLELEARGLNLGAQMKATVEAGTTLDSTYAAPLVQYQNFAGDFIEYLRPRTILGQFGANGVPGLTDIPFNVRIAGQTSGGSAYWVGEGAPKPLTSFEFNDVELRWAKIATIAVLTNELIRFSSPSAERLVRDALAGAVIERADIDFIDPNKAAVANVSPASITNGVTAIPAIGTNAEGIRADIRKLWAPFIAARNAPRNAVYIMDSTTALALSQMQNPLGQDEFPGLTINGGQFLGVPTIVSDYLPRSSAGGIIVLVNASDIWLADDGQVTIDVSQEASLQMLDNPTNNSATGTATSLVSMFQTNSTAFRAERYLNWAKRRASAVSYLSGVDYDTI